MARPKAKHSKSSLSNLGLDPAEDAVLKALIKLTHYGSVRNLNKKLIRTWMSDNKHLLK